MTEHFDDITGEPAPEPEIASRRRKEPRTPFYRRKFVQAAFAAVAIGACTVGVGKSRADKWNERLAGFKTNEANLIEKQRQPAQAKCLGRTLLLRSGVTYRETPNSADFTSRIPTSSWFAGDNIAGRVQNDQELEVKMPKWSLDADGNQWISFKLVDNPNDISTKPGKIKNSVQVANETVWVNYGQLKGSKNSNGDYYITEKTLTNTPEMSMDLVDCTIEKDGRTTVNDHPVAYGKIYPVGHFKEVTDFMSFPKAA